MDDAGCLGYLFVGALAIGLLYVIVVFIVIPIITYIFLPALVITAGTGAIIGGGTTLGNYIRSFRENMPFGKG